MIDKKIGYAFLFLGVIIILWGVWFSYGIFTGKKPAPELFKMDSSDINLSLPKISGVDQQMQNQVNSILQSQLGSLLAGDSVSKILNLTAWSIFMAILVMACGKISTIGINLIKESKKI